MVPTIQFSNPNSKIIIIVLLAAIYTSESRQLHHALGHKHRHNETTHVPYCPCIENSDVKSATVHDLLHPSHGIERLVVFLYRDVATDQVRMYEPSIEKQKLIPDTPVGDGDLLTPISTETIVTIFNKSPNKIIQLNDSNMPALLINETEPIPVKNIESDQDAELEDEELLLIPVHTLDQNNIMEYNNVGSFNNNAKIKKDDEYLREGDEEHPAPYAIISKQIHQGQEQFNEWVIEQMKIFTNYETQGQNNIDLSTIRNTILQMLEDNDIYLTDNGILMDSYGTVVDMHSISLRPILFTSTLSLRDQHAKPLSSHVQSPYLHVVVVIATQPPRILGVMHLGKVLLTLNELANIWATDSQIEVRKLLGPDVLKLLSSFDMSKSGSDTLKQNVQDDIVDVEAIKNFAYTNNINFPQQSILTKDKQTSYGDTDLEEGANDSDIGRLLLKLRSTENNVATKTSSPTPNTPKTTQQTKSKKKRVSRYIKKLSNLRKTWKHPNSLDIVLTKRFLPAKTLENAWVKYNHSRSMPSINVEQDIYSRKIPPNYVETSELESVSKTKQTPHNGFEPDTIPYVITNRQSDQRNRHHQNLLLPQPLSHLSSTNRASDTPNLPSSEPSVVYDFLIMGEDDDDDDDGDFRIIGGNAATGSGTPLSNKGRSGYVF